jgi:DNA-binding transcriptional regulator YiaG
MPNIAKVLKEEISRIGRKEAKAANRLIHHKEVRLAKAAVDLKRRVVELEKAMRLLQQRLAALEAVQPVSAATGQESKREWISGKGIRRLRKKLGLSQAAFAKLVGVSIISVYQWEKHAGMLKLRKATKAAVFGIRGIGAREAKRRLEEVTKAGPAKKPSRRRAT